MKVKEVRAMSEGELRARLSEIRAELTSLRFKSHRGSIEQPHRIGQMRRDVARILTLLQERPAGAQAQSGKAAS
jgi:large subunit ribosomal protein L29